jgi:hypothetical protein
MSLSFLVAITEYVVRTADTMTLAQLTKWTAILAKLAAF